MITHSLLSWPRILLRVGGNACNTCLNSVASEMLFYAYEKRYFSLLAYNGNNLI